MTPYEKCRLYTWDRTGLLDKCKTVEEKLKEALKWEDIAKHIIIARWGK